VFPTERALAPHLTPPATPQEAVECWHREQSGAGALSATTLPAHALSSLSGSPSLTRTLALTLPLTGGVTLSAWSLRGGVWRGPASLEVTVEEPAEKSESAVAAVARRLLEGETAAPSDYDYSSSSDYAWDYAEHLGDSAGTPPAAASTSPPPAAAASQPPTQATNGTNVTASAPPPAVVANTSSSVGAEEYDYLFGYDYLFDYNSSSSSSDYYYGDYGDYASSSSSDYVAAQANATATKQQIDAERAAVKDAAKQARKDAAAEMEHARADARAKTPPSIASPSDSSSSSSSSSSDYAISSSSSDGEGVKTRHKRIKFVGMFTDVDTRAHPAVVALILVVLFGGSFAVCCVWWRRNKDTASALVPPGAAASLEAPKPTGIMHKPALNLLKPKLGAKKAGGYEFVDNERGLEMH